MDLAGLCKAEDHNGWLLCMQIDDQFRQLMSGTEADPMVVHFADIPRIMVSPTALYACHLWLCTMTVHC